MLFAVILVIRSRQSQIQPSHASLSLSTNVVDLGRTSARREWRVPFQVCNSGDKRLVINEVDAACCGDSARETIIIPPGETVEVAVNLDTRFGTGPVENIASFTTSDPDHPRFNLTVRAFVAVDDPVVADPDDPNQVSVLIRQ